MTSALLFRLAAITILLQASVTNAEAQFGHKVTEVKRAGTPTNSAAGITVALPKSERRKQTVTVGQHFPSGTHFETPAATSLTITSDNGNIIRMEENTIAELTASDKGESITALLGKVWFVVKNKLSFFRTQDGAGKVLAAPSATKFSIEVSDKRVVVDRTEGKVVINQAVRLRIGQTHGGRERNRRPDLTRFYTTVLTNQERRQVFDFDSYGGNTELFENYDLAEAIIGEQWQRGRRLGDRSLMAHSLTTLGFIVLQRGSPREAIKLFNDALQISRALESEGVHPTLTRDLIGLGWAHLDSREPEQALRYFSEAFQFYAEIRSEEPIVAEILLARAEAWKAYGREGEVARDVSGAKGLLKVDISNTLSFLGEAMRAVDNDLVRFGRRF